MTAKFFVRHSAAILLAILAGALTVIPQLLVERKLGSDFQGIHKEMNDDEGYYVARFQEVINGHQTLGNPYLYEHKAQPPLQVWIPEAFMTRVSVAIFGEIRTMTLVWDFVFPAIIFLLTYAIGLLITERRLSAKGLATLLSIGTYLEILNRSPSPQINFVFLLLFVYVFLRLVKAPTRPLLAALIVLMGSMFYIYTYYWTYLVIVLGVFGAASLFFFRETRLFLYAALTVGGGAVLAIPYFLELNATRGLPYYAESLARVGLITTHSPSGIFIVGVGSLVLLGYLIAWWRRLLPWTPLSVALASLVAAAMIAVNQHIITGINLEFSSHYHLLALYADFFAGAYLFATIIGGWRWREYVLRAALLLVILLSLCNAYHVVDKQLTLTPTFVSAQRYAPTLQWLQTNTDKDDVVYTDSTLSFLIPQYTHSNAFYSSAAVLYVMPQADVRARFLLQHYLDAPLSREEMTTGLAMERAIYGNYYIDESAHRASLNTLRGWFGLAPLPYERYPEEDIAALLVESAAVQARPFLEQLAPYRVDYLVWDRAQHPTWQVERVPGLTKRAEIGDFTVYEISKR